MTAIHLPQDRHLVRVLAEVARSLEERGYDGIWVGEVNGLDAVVPAALAGSGTHHADIGVLLNAYTRAPATLAMTAATLADVAPGRMHIVFGAASRLLVERWNGIRYERPLAHIRDSLRFVKAALSGGRVTGEYETFATNGFALSELPTTPPELLVAASGPQALELATTEADGVVVNWVTADDIDRIHPLPEDRSRVSVVFVVCPSTDRTVVDSIMRPVMADYLNAPGYASQQRRVGRGSALEAMWEAWSAGDRKGARRQLPSAVIDELVTSGPMDECLARLVAIEAEYGVRAIATLFLPEGEVFLDVATAGAGPLR